MDICIF